MFARIAKNDIVKIARSPERFWVIITQITRNKIYATVDNDVIYQPFKAGDSIEIKESEVVDIWVD